ncbi:MAG: hypothetical protein ABL866_06575 [Devosia sp.]
MRSLAALLFVLTLAPPASAQSIADQAQRAYQTFAGGLSQPAFMVGGIGQAALDGLAGKWARLGGPDPKTGVESYGTDRDKLCASDTAVIIAAPSAVSLDVTSTPPDGTFVQHYTLVAGATFAEHTDPTEYFAAIGLGPNKQGVNADQQRAIALSLVNGLVQIYRPSADILVMTRDRGYPLIFARCA